MSRAVIAVMAGLLCALAGMKRAASLKGDAARLTRWVQILRHLALLLKEGTLSIPEALCAAADESQPPDKLLHELASRLAAAPMEPLAGIFETLCDTQLENPTLSRFFTKLSHGSKESRILAAEQCGDELQLLALAASQKAEKDAKLWQTLGFTGGVCLTILIL